jgi:hypothetical protein
MSTHQATPCLFCGSDTEEEHTTSIGTINIHSECLVDLEDILSVTVEEMEDNQNLT